MSANDAERKTRQAIALALDWGNVPPLDLLVRDIRARERVWRRSAGEAKLMEDCLRLLLRAEGMTPAALQVIRNVLSEIEEGRHTL